MSTEANKPLTAQQAADRLGIKLSTVYALCQAGRISHVRHGLGRGTIRIAEIDLDRYLQSVRVETMAEVNPPDRRRNRPAPVRPDWEKRLDEMMGPKKKVRAKPPAV